jgi:hypothetical protein
MKIEFPRQFSKNTHILNLMKIRSAGAELFHADGQTQRQTDRQPDMTQLIVFICAILLCLKRNYNNNNNNNNNNSRAAQLKIFS